MGGSLSVESNYDYIQINATGNADQVLTILEAVASAVTKPTLDKETTAQVKTVRLAQVKQLEEDPAYVADLAVAKRLFGDYPYGRSAEGTSESLAKIDFADLILAKQRFLTADNATIAISGNIKYDHVLKAVRQLYGGWEKADKKVPATFAQPTAPDMAVLAIKSPSDERSELRMAFRGVARNDKDFWTAATLARILGKRFESPARQTPNLLPGMFMLNISATNVKIGPPYETGIRIVSDAMLKPPIKIEELTEAKSFVMNEEAGKNLAEKWLDADTYKIASMQTDALAAQNVTLADVQQMAEKMRQKPMATVLVLRAVDFNAPKNQ